MMSGSLHLSMAVPTKHFKFSSNYCLIVFSKLFIVELTLEHKKGVGRPINIFIMVLLLLGIVFSVKQSFPYHIFY